MSAQFQPGERLIVKFMVRLDSNRSNTFGMGLHVGLSGRRSPRTQENATIISANLRIRGQAERWSSWGERDISPISFEKNLWHEVILRADFETHTASLTLDGHEVACEDREFFANSVESLFIGLPYYCIQFPDYIFIDNLSVERVGRGNSYLLNSSCDVQFFDSQNRPVGTCDSCVWATDRSGVATSMRIKKPGPYLWRRFKLDSKAGPYSPYADFGDVNGDNVINTDDYLIISGQKGQRALDPIDSFPNPTWNPSLDLYKDGVINSTDIEVLNNFIGAQGDD